MFKAFAVTLMLFSGLVYSSDDHNEKTTKSTRLEWINKTVVPSGFELYTQTSDGIMDNICSAANFYKGKHGYFLVTAAHCVEKKRVRYLVGSNIDGNLFLFRATVIAVGDYHVDCAVLYIATSLDLPIVPFGQDPSMFGETIVNVSSPNGMGIKLFSGTVTNPVLKDRPYEFETRNSSELTEFIDWYGNFSVSLFGVGGGSSGSGVICEDQQAICGILVGHIGQNTHVVLPVSKIKSFIIKHLKDDIK